MGGLDVDQIVIISDGEENAPPRFADMLRKYEEARGKKVKVFLVKVRSEHLTPLETDMMGKDFTVINFDGDYYNLPNVIPLLCAGNNFELVEEVLALPLYTIEKMADLPVQFDEKTFEILL
jgi:hypothetical protein